MSRPRSAQPPRTSIADAPQSDPVGNGAYGDNRTNSIHIDKAQIVAALRSRGLDDRADWVDRQMPQIIDTLTNASLLQMLDIDATTMTPVDEAPPAG